MGRKVAESLVEKFVQPGIGLVSACPTTGLVAVGTSDHRIHVYRLNGQRIINVRPAGAADAMRLLAWKPDGQALAAAYESAGVLLIDAISGQTLHRLTFDGIPNSCISLLSWSRFCSTINTQEEFPDEFCEAKLVPLGRHLSGIDIETLLPQLAPLSSGGIEDDVYATKTSLDSIFPGKVTKDSATDILLTASDDGEVHVSIYDLFEIGRFPSEHVSNVVAQSSHGLSSSHGLITSDTRGVSWTLLDLKILVTSSQLPVVAAKSAQMLHLVRYARLAITQMQAELRTSFELPQRFISSLEESFESGTTWLSVAYQLILTGHCDASTKEWLTTILGERGHKRWDKAITNGYETIRRLSHQHLLPAIQRIAVLAGRLRGLSKFFVTSRELGLQEADVAGLMDCVGAMQSSTHQVLIHAMKELEQFQAYSAWLHHEIGVQSVEEKTSEQIEAATKIDHRNALAYIEGPMSRSALPSFLNQEPSRAFFDAHGQPLWRLYDHRQDDKSLPDLGQMLDSLADRLQMILQRVSAGQQRHVRYGPTLSIHNAPARYLASRTIDILGKFRQFIAVEASGQVSLHHIDYAIDSGTSKTTEQGVVLYNLHEWNVRDLKFANNDTMLALVTQQDHSRVLAIPVSHEDLDVDILATTYLQFHHNATWTPAVLSISEASDQPFVVITSADSLQFQVFSLS